MRFIVFENLKHFSKSVVRVYPVQNIAHFEYDKIGKIFTIKHVDGSWHTIKNDDEDTVRNEKIFEQTVALLKEKVTFR